MVIFLWGVQYHGENREYLAWLPNMHQCSGKWDNKKRIVDPGLDIASKAHRGKACVGAQRLVNSIQKKVQNGAMNGSGGFQFGWGVWFDDSHYSKKYISGQCPDWQVPTGELILLVMLIASNLGVFITLVGSGKSVPRRYFRRLGDWWFTSCSWERILYGTA